MHSTAQHSRLTCSRGLATSDSAAGSAASATAAAASGLTLHSVTNSFSAWAARLRSVGGGQRVGGGQGAQGRGGASCEQLETHHKQPQRLGSKAQVCRGRAEQAGLRVVVVMVGVRG